MKNWKKYNGTLIQSNPPHFHPKVSDREVKQLMKRHNSYFARWCTNFDCKYKTDFWYIINDTPLKIEDYSVKVRNTIRKGLKELDIRMIKREKFVMDAFQVYLSAIERYNISSTMLEKEFIDQVCQKDHEIDLWGIYKESKMVGYAIVKVDVDVCEYQSIKFDPFYFKFYPSESLIYILNQTYLNERNFRYVNSGSRSLHHNTNFQLFLTKKFKFRKAYCKMHIIYSPWVKIILAILFPLRFIIKMFNNDIANKIMVLIRHEQIRRSYL